jgi:hypothetical protein
MNVDPNFLDSFHLNVVRCNAGKQQQRQSIIPHFGMIACTSGIMIIYLTLGRGGRRGVKVKSSSKENAKQEKGGEIFKYNIRPRSC